jgi:collagen beta-1,O-galactosyltransferase
LCRIGAIPKSAADQFEYLVACLAMTVTAAVWTVLLAASFAAAALGSAFDGRKPNTVFVAILVRNKAHTLPYFFSAFESLDYPKDRMHLW